MAFFNPIKNTFEFFNSSQNSNELEQKIAKIEESILEQRIAKIEKSILDAEEKQKSILKQRINKTEDSILASENKQKLNKSPFEAANQIIDQGTISKCPLVLDQAVAPNQKTVLILDQGTTFECPSVLDSNVGIFTHNLVQNNNKVENQTVNVLTKEQDLLLEIIDKINDSEGKKNFISKFKDIVKGKPSTSSNVFNSSHPANHPKVLNT